MRSHGEWGSAAKEYSGRLGLDAVERYWMTVLLPAHTQTGINLLQEL